jgi:hypothetical protein
VRDTRRPTRFAQPYPAREALYWLVKNLTGPRRCHVPFAALARDVVLNPIVPRLTVAFVGDVLPTRHATISVAPEVQAFIRAADWLVANLEGPVVEGPVPWVFMGQPHTPAILDFLGALAPPERTVLLCANNHAADYGRRVHERSQAFLRRHGVLCAGDRSAATVSLTAEVAVTAGTAWSNQRQDFLAPLPAVPPAGPMFQVLSPHWGYELEAVPRRWQIHHGERWLQAWDAVIGHHSHTPQPITASLAGAIGRPIAYSLGNFTFAYDLAHHRHGRILSLEIGPATDGSWAVGRLRWAPIVLRFAARGRGTVVLEDGA